MQNNQYNLYVDLDEEITIVVGRVRAAKAAEITLVVPQHAVVLQSIINLRLLAREAKKQNKNLVIVTQDEEGADFAGRAGIAVVPLQEWQELHAAPEDVPPAAAQTTMPVYRGEDSIHAEPEMQMSSSPSSPSMDGMIATDGAAPLLPARAHAQQDPTGLAEEVENIMHHDDALLAHSHAGMDIAPQSTPRAMDMGVGAHVEAQPVQSLEESFQQSLQEPLSEEVEVLDNGFDRVHAEFTSTDVDGQLRSHARVPDVQQEAEQQHITNDYTPRAEGQGQFSDGGLGTNGYTPTQPSMGGNINGGLSGAMDGNMGNGMGGSIQPGRPRSPLQAARHTQPAEHPHLSFFGRLLLHTRRAFSRRKESESVLGLEQRSGFGLFRGTSLVIGILILVLLAATAVLPFSRIELETLALAGQQDLTLTVREGDLGVDIERRLIGGRIIEKDITFTIETQTTGESSDEAQKAQGTITIINKHSASPQPLVATTRFTAEDGTLFRLVQATTIPGFTQKENGDVIPGEVEALVAADEAGEAGNIGPTTFTVPGFGEGTDKFREITAQTGIAMTGGSETSSGKKTVTEADLARAKVEAEAGREAFIQSEIEGLLRPDAEVFLSDTLEEEIVRSEPNAVAGSAITSIEHTIVTHIRAFVFSHTDVERIAKSALTASQPRLDQETTEYSVEYKSAKADYDDKKTSVSFVGAADVPQEIDIEAFVEDVKGKKHDALKDLITEKYPTISNIFVTSYPSFPSFLSQKVSPLQGMTNIEVK